jgi:hypothetical protein
MGGFPGTNLNAAYPRGVVVDDTTDPDNPKIVSSVPGIPHDGQVFCVVCGQGSHRPITSFLKKEKRGDLTYVACDHHSDDEVRKAVDVAEGLVNTAVVSGPSTPPTDLQNAVNREVPIRGATPIVVPNAPGTPTGPTTPGTTPPGISPKHPTNPTAPNAPVPGSPNPPAGTPPTVPQSPGAPRPASPGKPTGPGAPSTSGTPTPGAGTPAPLGTAGRSTVPTGSPSSPATEQSPQGPAPKQPTAAPQKDQGV